MGIHPYRTEFTYNSKIIIDNMFQEHIARRFLHGASQKVRPTYLIPMASTKVNTTAIVGWSSFGIGIISLTIMGSLYLFQRAERKRLHNQNYLLLN